MYANLRVTIGGVESFACEVRIEGQRLTVVEDLNDGGSHEERGEERTIDLGDVDTPAITIKADF